jgi:hypothetical protein
LDVAGNAYLSGSTTSDDLTTTSGAYNRTKFPEGDTYAVKINTTASTPSAALVYGTYLGELAGGGRARVDPQSQAFYIPVYGAVGDTTIPSTLLLKLNPSGSALEYKRRVGPERMDTAVAAVAVDEQGHVYVGGYFDDSVLDGYVSRIDENGVEAARLEFAAREHDIVYAIAIGPSGHVYAAGGSNSPDFPTTASAPQRRYGGGDYDGFVAKVSFDDVSTVNVADRRPATSSSNEASQYPPSAAFDGDFGTRWSSRFSDPQWVAVDLGQRYRVERVTLYWETAYSSQYELHISDDGVNWYPLTSTAIGWNSTPQEGGVDNHLNLNGTGRYVRVYGIERATEWGYSLWEMQVFGDPVSTPAPAPGTVNIALGARTGASSIESVQLGSSNATDGNRQTRWSSEFSDPQWIFVDLESTLVRISRVVLRWEMAYGRDYQLQVSNDLVHWTTVRSVINGNGGVDDLTDLNAMGRYVRVYGTRRGTPWGYSPWEFEVYGVIHDVSAPPPPPPGKQDIVMYASADRNVFQGLSDVHDSTAAGGVKVSSADQGRAWPDHPPAPGAAPYAVYRFNVPEAGDYRLWLRMRGQGDSKWNESVWVQFSDATRSGAPVYRIGSGSALLVNLENCSGCGIQSWGWQDNSWWLNQSSLVHLPAGWQEIQIMLREDGVEFDQIVLSPERYLTNAPGPVKNDSTMVPKP